MKMVVLSVFDRAAEGYGRPIFAASRGLALRSFQDEVNRVDPANEMNKHPQDFVLYEFGTFDDSDGRFELFQEPRIVVHGQEVLIKSH